MKEIQELTALKETLNQYLVLNDWEAIDLIMAVAVAHKLPGEMLWLRIIGASGTGKSEILRSLATKGDYCETLETLTPSAIRRGFKAYKKKEGEEEATEIALPKLLERINGKLVITKELAPLLTRDRESKLEVFGLLRSVHDGELDADYGSWEGHIKQKTHFDWLIASTTYADRTKPLEQQLGSRFMDLRWGKPLEREAAVAQAMDNDPYYPAIRKRIAGCVSDLIDVAKPEAARDFDRPDWLVKLAAMVGILRTPVLRDGKEIMLELPDESSELGTRPGQAFARIYKGLMMLGIDNPKPYIIRLTWDSMLPLRARILKARLNGCDTQDKIASAVGVSQPTVGRELEDLVALKVMGTKREPLLDFDLLREHMGRSE